MRAIGCLIVLFYAALSLYAGPHTLQKGETLADVAKLYNISLDSLIKANPNTDVYVGLTIEVPLSTLVYDLGDSELFRNMRYRNATNYKKGLKKYRQTYEKQLRLNRTTGKKRLKLEAQIISGYMEAVQYGNTDALYQLGRQKVHGVFYCTAGYPNFNQKVNTDVEEFKEGIEYLQIAALIGKNDKALIELAMACGYEDSPIRNPYLCLGMLEQYKRELGLDVNAQICYMYETGYGIHPNLLQAYIYTPTTELTSESGVKTHREKILEQIESMSANFDTSRYGVGLDSKTMMSIGFSYYHNDVLEPEGLFWLHRAARQNDADANWALASILQNGNHMKGSVGSSSNKESQILCFVRNAATNGKQEAKEYLEAYQRQQKAKAEQARREELERQRRIEEKKQRRRQMWANIAGSVIQAAAQTYVAVETAKMQSHQMQGFVSHSTQRMPVAQMSDAQWRAKNQLAMQQIAQYTINKTFADWTGTPMIPTDMSAVDLGTDMSPGSPLWNWGMQQQISTISTQCVRMSFERYAFYKRQADQLTQQLMENPFQPIAGYVDRDGNWISREMVAASYADTPSAGEGDNGYEGGQSDSNTYYAERYGNKDCPMCIRGICSTCNGKGYDYNEYGVQGTHECPNCFRVNGRASGKCGRCQGTGSVYGLK